MDRDELRALIQLVEESAIDELEVRRWGKTIRIVKQGGRAMVASGPAASTGPPVAPAPTAAAPAIEPAVPAGPPLHRITSPMVGTFYRAPAAEAPPFVEIGDAIRPGQTLCILEAMKLMNELQAEVSGTVRAVLVENGDPVEYGQALFDIER
ncbi:MAG: acetyl-CoA carboxylase biotin carboxyl carrier protein [Gemmatimonadota bacterium]